MKKILSLIKQAIKTGNYKLLSLLIAILLLMGIKAEATTTTVTCLPGTATNVFVGGAIVKQVVITATSSTNTLAWFFDTPVSTNFTYVVPAYSNTVSYATNVVYNNTNYNNYIQWFTNVGLIDQTNNIVPASTNFYPERIAMAALGGTSASIGTVNYQFINGMTVTNPTSAPGGPVTVTVTYQQ